MKKVLPFLLLLSGCAMQPPSHPVTISAVTSPSAAYKKTFVIAPGPNIGPLADFDNVSNVLVSALIEHGFVLATPDDAELVISVNYKPENSSQSYTSTVPVYGTVPGPISRINATTVPIGSPNGPTLTTGTITNYPVQTVVGQQTQTNTVLISTLYANVDAYDAGVLRKISRGGSMRPELVWQVSGFYTNRNKFDQSEAARWLMKAVAAYAGTNSGIPIQVGVR